MTNVNHTLIDIIKSNPSRFIHTIQCRAFSTPNPMNKANHLLLKELIDGQHWDKIPRLIYSRNYAAAFEGVLTCLNIMNYDDDFCVDNHAKIIKLYNIEYKEFNRK